MMKKSNPDEKGIVLCLRLSDLANEKLRMGLFHKGDISDRVNQAILGLDFSGLSIERRKRGSGVVRHFESTSARLVPTAYEKIYKIAQLHGVSVMAVIDIAIIQYFSMES